MDKFVKIKKVFNREPERNLDFLASIYKDNDRLISILKSVTTGWLNKTAITGKRILIKPNWVKHSTSLNDDICLRTNDNFVLTLLELILQFNPSSIIIGDAPIQECNWNRMITETYKKSVSDLSNKYNCNIVLRDFRKSTFNPKLNISHRDLQPEENYTVFDLGKDSLLDPISKRDKNTFRVTYYNPDILSEVHRFGVHMYSIVNELFNVDLVISVPKIKTHQKTGLTAALKNLVGLTGNKDYLPHHRLGGTGFGGDCYPGKNYFRYLSELLRDNANRRQGTHFYKPYMKISTLFWRMSLPGLEHNLGAGWYGNDTAWRMVIDLNKIAIFGTSDGHLSKFPQRVILSICDGIIGGQGNGPLKPDPLPLGIVSFTNNPGIHDLCIGKILGFETAKVPMLKAISELFNIEETSIYLNDELSEIDALEPFSIGTRLPDGWINYQSIRP